MTKYLDTAIQTFDVNSLELMGRLISITGSRPNSYELCRYLIRNQSRPSFRSHIINLVKHVEKNLKGLEKIDTRRKSKNRTKDDGISVLKFITKSLATNSQNTIIANPDDQKRRLLRVKKPISLREYQEECADKILEGLRDIGNSLLLVLPRGRVRQRLQWRP